MAELDIAQQRSVTAASTTELAAIVQRLRETNTPITVISSELPAAANSVMEGVIISLEQLNNVTADAAALVLHADAGATISAVQEAAAVVGMEVIGLTSGHHKATHVGSLIARGEISRRSITALDALFVTGEWLRSPGPVLKDVAGYDVAATLIGSMGRYAIITAANFRLAPAGSNLITPPAHGEHVLEVGPSLAKAFDPQQLLRPMVATG